MSAFRLKQWPELNKRTKSTPFESTMLQDGNGPLLAKRRVKPTRRLRWSSECLHADVTGPNQLLRAWMLPPHVPPLRVVLAGCETIHTQMNRIENRAYEPAAAGVLSGSGLACFFTHYTMAISRHQ